MSFHGISAYSIGSAIPGLRLCSQTDLFWPLDADEAVIFNNSAGNEPLLGRCILRVQGRRPGSANWSYCNIALWNGWTLLAFCLALVARTCPAWKGSGGYPLHGSAPLRAR